MTDTEPRTEPAGLIALAERLHLAEHGCDGNCGQPMPVGWAARAYDLGIRAEREARDPVPEGHWAPTRDYWRQRALDAEARATAPDVCETCERWRREYNVATANGLVGQARLIDRRIAAHERDHQRATAPAGLDDLIADGRKWQAAEDK